VAGKGGAVEARDRAQHGGLHLRRDGEVELTQPRALLVAAAPLSDGLPEVVQLHAAMVRPGPHVEQAPAELGVPHQRGQVVEHHRHADVVDRRVRERADSVVGGGAAAEQPQVAGAGQVGGLVQAQAALARHGSSSAEGGR